MHKSADRILTTHAGSIPRGEPLGQMLIDEEAGKPVDNSALESNIGLRVSHVLEKRRLASISSMMANRGA
jgi:hypothetical protein